MTMENRFTLVYRCGGKLPPCRPCAVRKGGRDRIMACADEREIRFFVWFSERGRPLSLCCANTEGERELRLICEGHRLSLTVNGVLTDEEWPLGVCDVIGAEIEAACGEAFLLPSAETPPRPPENVESIQGFQPAGENAGAGDCMPFVHGGVFHLFYLYDRRGHRSKWNFGAHQWAHLSTRDMRSWTSHPFAVEIDGQWEASICTGSLLYAGGRYYAFYTIRMSDYSGARLTWSVSEDGVRFVKSRKYLTLTEPYDAVSARDPAAFFGADGRYHLLVTTSARGETGWKGALAHLVSADLERWEQQPPFYVGETARQPECPDYFEHGGKYYLIYSDSGVGRYLLAEAPFGPWRAPKDNLIVDSGFRVPKTAKWNGRIVAAGFRVAAGRGYAGKIELYELIPDANGLFRYRFFRY